MRACEFSRRVLPESGIGPDDASAPIEQARTPRRLQASTTEAAALCRARAEKAGHQVVPQHLERTA